MGWSSFCWNRIEVGGLSCARAVLEVVEEDSKYGGETVNRQRSGRSIAKEIGPSAAFLRLPSWTWWLTVLETAPTELDNRYGDAVHCLQ